MRVVVCLAALFATVVKADEVTDRAAIQAVIEAVNNPSQRPRLFAKDVDSTVNFDRLIDLHLTSPARAGIPVGTPEPTRILTEPHIVSGAIRFMTPDVAIADGASVVHGAVTFADTVPLLFVLKKERGEWRIHMVRRLYSARRGLAYHRPQDL